jgi:hypothetical protein
MEKYHIALSFAGEDREYVDKVAQRLQGTSKNKRFAELMRT